MALKFEQKRKVVKGYLGPFIAKPSTKVRQNLSKYSCDQNLLISCNTSEINQVLTCLLVKSGRKNYKVFSASEIIDIYLGKSVDYSNYADIEIKNVFVLIQKYEMDNVRRFDLPIQLCMYRKNKGYPTVVVTDENRPEYFKKFQELGFKHITLSHLSKNDSEEDF